MRIHLHFSPCISMHICCAASQLVKRMPGLESQNVAEAIPMQFLLKESVVSSAAAAAAAGAKNRHAADAMLRRYWRLDAESESCRDAGQAGSQESACRPV